MREYERECAREKEGVRERERERERGRGGGGGRGWDWEYGGIREGGREIAREGEREKERERGREREGEKEREREGARERERDREGGRVECVWERGRGGDRKRDDSMRKFLDIFFLFPVSRGER